MGRGGIFVGGAVRRPTKMVFGAENLLVEGGGERARERVGESYRVERIGIPIILIVAKPEFIATS